VRFFFLILINRMTNPAMKRPIVYRVTREGLMRLAEKVFHPLTTNRLGRSVGSVISYFFNFIWGRGKRFCTTAAEKPFLSQYVDTAAKVTSKGKYFFVLIYLGKAKRPPHTTRTHFRWSTIQLQLVKFKIRFRNWRGNQLPEH